MNEHRQRHNPSAGFNAAGEPRNEQILAGVRRHMSDVESQVPLPPLWQPTRRSIAMSESPNPVRVSIRPASAIGLGGLALVAVVAVVAALVLGPWRAAGPQGGHPTGSNVAITFIVLSPNGSLTQQDVQRVADVMKQRAVAAGVADVTTTLVGPDEVRIELPGLDPGQAENMAALLGKVGKLEFVLLPRDLYGYYDNTQGYVPGTALTAAPPPSEGDFIDATLPVQFSGDQLDPAKIAAANDSSIGAWVVEFGFAGQAAGDFETWSGDHINDYFAIVLDGRVVSAPYIKAAITGGQGQIGGGFTERTARDLATVLRYGALPFPVEMVSIERPSDGQASPVGSLERFTTPVTTPAATTPPDVPSNGRTLGDPNASVTLDLWSDFRCPRCFDFAKQTEPRLIADYVRSGKLRIVYHDILVIDSFVAGSTESRDAANAARCAADQGKFWAFSDWLWANQSPSEQPGAFTLDRLVEIGRYAGLDLTTFEPCVRQGAHNADVVAESAGAPSDLVGSPTLYVNGTQVTGAEGTIPTYQDLSTAIDRALAPASPVASPCETPGSSACGSFAP